MRAAIVGSTGEVKQVLRLGPSSLARRKRWDDATPMAELFRDAGYDAYVNHPLDNSLADPELWVLTDVPKAALQQSGLHPRIAETLANGAARVLVLGGCFAFGGAQGTGSWGDDPILPVICAGSDDTCERIPGVVARAVGGTPAPAWTSFGFNRVTARPETLVLAMFENAPAWVQDADKSRTAWMTGLFPHWGPRQHERDQVVRWLAGLYRKEES